MSNAPTIPGSNLILPRSGPGRPRSASAAVVSESERRATRLLFDGDRYFGVGAMRFRGAAIIVLTGSLLGCGLSRIKKLPVPQEKVIEAYRLMGEADEMMNEGKDHLAVLKYVEATTLNPYHEAIFNRLAIAYCRTGRYWQGRKAAERSIRLQPGYASGYNTLGIVALSNRKYKQAVGYFEKAIALDPKASYHVNLGYSQMMRGRYEEARGAYLQAALLDPEIFKTTSVSRLTYPDPMGMDSETNYNLARLFAEMGNQAQCLKYLGKALAAGFADQERLAADGVFDGIRENQEFIELLNLYGLTAVGKGST